MEKVLPSMHLDTGTILPIMRIIFIDLNVNVSLDNGKHIILTLYTYTPLYICVYVCVYIHTHLMFGRVKWERPEH